MEKQIQINSGEKSSRLEIKTDRSNSIDDTDLNHMNETFKMSPMETKKNINNFQDFNIVQDAAVMGQD